MFSTWLLYGAALPSLPQPSDISDLECLNTDDCCERIYAPWKIQMMHDFRSILKGRSPVASFWVFIVHYQIRFYCKDLTRAHLADTPTEKRKTGRWQITCNWRTHTPALKKAARKDETGHKRAYGVCEPFKSGERQEIEQRKIEVAAGTSECLDLPPVEPGVLSVDGWVAESLPNMDDFDFTTVQQLKICLIGGPVKIEIATGTDISLLHPSMGEMYRVCATNKAGKPNFILNAALLSIE